MKSAASSAHRYHPQAGTSNSGIEVECLPQFIERWKQMPTYEYLCKDCHDRFEKSLTIRAHDKDEIACPKCGSTNVEQEYTAFYAITSKKSA